MWNVDFMLCLDSFSLRLFTDALDVGEIDSADWFRFFFSWLVVVFVLLFKMPLSSGFVNELLTVSIGLEDFCDVCSCLGSVLLVMTFTSQLNNAVVTLFDLVE